MRRWSSAASLAWGALSACDSPSVLEYHGVTGSHEATLGWFLIITSAIVVVVVAALVLIAALRSRRQGDTRLAARSGAGLPWIMIGGIVVPTIILTGAFVFTTIMLGAVSAPSKPVAATVRVIGHQWWWEVQYQDARPAQIFTTANEIHVPVGRPVRLELQAADVIHSFWVPQLAGKTDLIPGQTNVTWIEAKEPGIYYGRCGEYCGAQHAHMWMTVVAQPPGEFARWLASQRQPAPTPVGAATAQGLKVFLGVGCANCHTIRGTPAGGLVGPDLTHLASRATIAAGTLTNTRGNLAGWVIDAQGIKPGAAMPTMAIRPADLQTLLAYLETLK